ncbi:GGDEF domain-containing protein [Alteromonas sp. a30]|uniref:GGDEF domain-containing protein n=1 Tax=Alteromonas sp. a30 TaxID=2730917 RepID=UPI0022807EE6|nr:GGDEF domain-containing protein [Alteromonas sp. a30]MCY7294721.1 diguanylate cyclase [Alteromonas sp. a30]
MKYHDSHADSRAKMQSAIQLLDTHNLTYTPVNYSVAYEYVSGENPELIQLIDDYINVNKVDAFVLESLYNEFIVNKTPQDESNVYKLNGAIDSLHTSCETSSEVLQALDESVQSTVDEHSTETQRLVVELKQSQAEMMAFVKEAQLQAHTIRNELESAKIEAITDPLTQLLNRQALNKMFDSYRSDSGDNELSAAMVDIDYFKKFNDDYGHLIGDVILRRIAKLFRDVIDTSGEVFRYGGEEFVILIPNIEPSEAYRILDDIRTRVEKLRFVSAKTKERLPKLTISAGVTQYVYGEPLESLISRADEALYQAKRQGRNRIIDLALQD